jgi:PAS domain S-box-containing protein
VSGPNFISPLTLRAKGVAVLSAPIVALMVALLWTSWSHNVVREADRAVSQAAEGRIEILQLEMLALDPKSPQAAIDRSLERLASLGGGPVAEVRAALAQRDMGAVRGSLAPILRDFDVRLLDAQAVRTAAEQSLSRTLLLCGILGSVGALLLHLLISARLARRLAWVEENARRLAHGLPLEPARRAADEIGALERKIEEAAALLSARERESRESEQRYRDLFDRAPVPYQETDRDGIVRRFNQEVCTLLKCTPDRVECRRAWEFVIPDQREAFRRAMLDRIANAIETAPFECEYELANGARIVVEVRESLIRNQAGEVLGMCSSLLDVTERKLASVAARKVAQYAMELRNKNEQLAHALEAARSATEAKSRFLASVSHELRTPLNGIIGFSELLYDGKLGAVAEEHRDVLADILSSARHLLQIISDILDLSKVEAGRMEFHPERVEIAPLVHEVRDVVRPLSERKSICVTTELPPALVAVLDPSRFKQVLYNYLSNAVKFTPDGGGVAVRILAADGAFRLEVEDTGIGIPPGEVSKLFQDFQQLSNGRGHGQGTGLGLALTRHIVEAQGGSVGVRSAPVRGTVFTATFPITTCEPARLS